MQRIFLWGTGNIAETTLRQCMTLDSYEILGFIDNNPQKTGSLFHGKKIFTPDILDYIIPDKIVILADAYKVIKEQIVTMYPQYENLIENKNFFYKESVLARYQNERNKEIVEVLEYIKINGLDVFNYEFKKKYVDLNIEVYRDKENGMSYVMHHGKRLFFSKKYNNKEAIIHYYKSILLEQDVNSPHRYISEDFCINSGDIVIDIGAAEGNFSLEIIEKVSKLYIIETDEDWIEALKETFKEYLDKVVIIKKFISSYDEGEYARLDTLIDEPVNFIKMDIEGNEWDGLWGAENLINRSDNLKLAICSYHSDFDQILIEQFMDSHGIKHSTSKGYLWFPWCIRQKYVSTRLNRAIIRGIK